MTAIPEEVYQRIQALSPSKRNAIKRFYGSSEGFCLALYHLWFVEKLEKSEIAEQLGLQAENIHIHLYNLSWHYSNDYIQNQREFEHDCSSMKKLFEEAKSEAIGLDEDAPGHEILKSALSKNVNLKKTTYSKLGFASKDEYIRAMYYIIEIKRIAPKELIPLLKLSHATVQQRLTSIGLNTDHENGIRRKKARESQDYGKSLRSGKRTRAKFQLATFSTGSKNQEYVRAQLSNMIDDCLNDSRYECIVGMSNTGILGALEIDIPLVVYDREEKKIHRFAIEYNGDYFHVTEEDANKEQVATEKGWIYISILETSNARISNNRKLLDQHVNDLCKRIKQIIMDTSQTTKAS